MRSPVRPAQASTEGTKVLPTTPHVVSTGQARATGKRISKRPGDRSARLRELENFQRLNAGIGDDA